MPLTKTSLLSLYYFFCMQYVFVAYFPCGLGLVTINFYFFIVLFEFIQKKILKTRMRVQVVYFILGNTGRDMGKWKRNRREANYEWLSSQLPLEKSSQSHFEILGDSKECPAVTPNREYLGVCISDTSCVIGSEMLPKI